MSCLCPPSENRACASQSMGSLDLVTIAQPSCVIITEEEVQSNPYFDVEDSFSFWGYKIIVGCNSSFLITPEAIYIPIYENIEAGSINIFERILSCGRFQPVTFDFSNPTGITPPSGFRFIRIMVGGRYTTGVAVNYILQIMGDFPESTQSLYVLDTDENVMTFTDAFVVPGEPENPRLTVMKTSEVAINGSQATITYTSTVTNTGNVDLTNVTYTDVINFDGALATIGTVTVDPDTLNIDTSMSGVIRVSGDIGDLAMGESAIITTVVPITAFGTSGLYQFTSITSAASGDVQNSTNNTTNIEVVEFATLATCDTPELFSGEFLTIIDSLNSPLTEVIVVTDIVVPSGVTVQFTSFDGCAATNAISGEPVPLNTDISSMTITVQCDITVAPNAIVTSTYDFNIISTTLVDSTVNITSTITDVRLAVPNTQVYLGAMPLPNGTMITVGGDAVCFNPCMT